MAEEYIIRLGQFKKKRNLAREANTFSEEVAKQDDNVPIFKEREEEDLDEFMIERKKMEIYDKLVRSLYKLTKQSIDQDMHLLNVQKAKTGRRGSVEFSRLVYIKNREAINNYEDNEFQEREKLRMLQNWNHQFGRIELDLLQDEMAKKDRVPFLKRPS